MLRITRNLKEHLHTFRWLTRTRISLETLRQTISDLVADAKDRDRQLETFRKSVSGLASDVENFERQVLANVRAIETNQSKIADYRDEIARLRSIVDLQRKSYLSVTRQLSGLSAGPAGNALAAEVSTPEDPFLDVFYREL